MALSGRSASARSDFGLVFLIAAHIDDTFFLFFFLCIGLEVKQKFFHLVYNRGLRSSGAYTVNTFSSYVLELVNKENQRILFRQAHV
jgi:hypothetical protein